MQLSRPLWLASGSPRRRTLLAEAGFDVVVEPADLDDGVLAAGEVPPSSWVVSLAYWKARRVADRLRERGVESGTVIGADTVCVCEGRILGQPRDRDHAATILDMLIGREHETLSGVCWISLATGDRRWFADTATVRMGRIDRDEIDAYLDSEAWRGKAGAYNLADRIDAGWPVTCDGDPTTVMGLPMQRLGPVLERSA